VRERRDVHGVRIGWVALLLDAGKIVGGRVLDHGVSLSLRPFSAACYVPIVALQA
jgi:hypothetical protein